MKKVKEKPTNLYPLAVVTLVGLFLVNILGFIDTQTASTLGCGREWPLCKGEIIPSVWDFHKAIEFIHRLSVVVDFVLLLVLTIATWKRYRNHKLIRLLMTVCFAGFLGESALGAMSVLFKNPPAVLALHMGLALISFIGLYLWTATLRQVEASNDKWFNAADSLPVRKLGLWTWGTLIYSFMVIYFGAFVSFTESGVYFQGWPFPTEPYQVAGTALLIDWTHRLMAMVLLIFILQIMRLTYRIRKIRRDLWTESLKAFIFMILQSLSGALLIYTKLHLMSFLLHVTFVTFLVCSLSFMGFKLFLSQEKGRRLASMLIHES